jgi:hypothetical protein
MSIVKALNFFKKSGTCRHVTIKQLQDMDKSISKDRPIIDREEIHNVSMHTHTRLRVFH